jgi:hypothetical protein
MLALRLISLGRLLLALLLLGLTAIDPDFGEAQAPGIGFAIPSNAVQSVASSLIASR